MQRAAGKAELRQAAAGVDAGDDGVEDAAEADGVAQPRQVGTAHDHLEPIARDAGSTFEQQHVRRQPHDVVDIVGDEHERNLQAAPQRIDFVLETPPDGAIDGGERFVEQQDVGLARERACQRDPLPLAARELVRTTIDVTGQVHQRQELPRPRRPFAAPAMPERGGDIARPRSGAERARTPGRRTRPRGDAAARNVAALVSVQTSSPERTTACAGR